MTTDKGALIGSAVFAALIGLLLLVPQHTGRLYHEADPAWAHPLVQRDLREVRHDTLRVLVLRDALTWEEQGNEATGLEWELLERFAKLEHLALRAVPVSDPDSMLLLLQNGTGDLMAAQLNPKGWAAPYIAFSDPYRRVAPLRIALRRDPLMGGAKRISVDPDIADTVTVSRWCTFRGVPMDSSMKVVQVIDPASPEQVLVNLVLGRTKAAIITDAEGTLWSRRLPVIEFGPRLGRSVPIAFGVRTNSPALLLALNDWLAAAREREARDLLIEAYERSALGQGPMRTLRALTFATDSISPYDSLFQLHADSTPLDWKLLAAVGFKESRFDTAAVSNAGAGGLMQLMPSTAASLGVDSTSGVGGHIRGASTYLGELDAYWAPSIHNRDQRLKFTLASYNAGYGHIRDAQRLAKLMGLDPLRWDGHVERTTLLLTMPCIFQRPDVKNGKCRGHETFWFVRDVIAAFNQYRKASAKK